MTREIFRIIEPGIYSSVQDGGRRGFRKFGMPLSGAMDPYAYNILNKLLGNEPGTACIEITGSWFLGEFLNDCSFVLSGAESGATLEGVNVRAGCVIDASKGSKLEFHGNNGGLRTYFGVSGGFSAKKMFGSMSMMKGQRLNKGDMLSRGNNFNEHLECSPDYSYINENGKYDIRIRKGPDSDLYKKHFIKDFIAGEYVVSPYSDRMGIRLDALMDIAGCPGDLVSKPIFPGCIQLTGSGNPIIIMNDGQTTGGYPVIAVVEKRDLRIAGQLKAGDTLVFTDG